MKIPMYSPLHARPPERERAHLRREMAKSVQLRSSGGASGGARCGDGGGGAEIGRARGGRWRRRLESGGGESRAGARNRRFFFFETRTPPLRVLTENPIKTGTKQAVFFSFSDSNSKSGRSQIIIVDFLNYI
jgi:hypothetical protein